METLEQCLRVICRHFFRRLCAMASRVLDGSGCPESLGRFDRDLRRSSRPPERRRRIAEALGADGDQVGAGAQQIVRRGARAARRPSRRSGSPTRARDVAHLREGDRAHRGARHAAGAPAEPRLAGRRGCNAMPRSVLIERDGVGAGASRGRGDRRRRRCSSASA